MNKNRIEGAVEQGERAIDREALVIKAKRRRSGTSTTRTARCGPACRVVWQGNGQVIWPPLCRFLVP